MSYPAKYRHDLGLRAIAKRTKVVIFSGIGVLFSATVFIDNKKEVLRQRSHVDGQGISFLRSAGLHIIFTACDSEDPFIDVLANRMNSLESVKRGKWDPVVLYKGVSGRERVKAILSWLTPRKITLKECAYMGNDMNDYKMMQESGLPAAPFSAEECIKDISLFISEREGGHGGVRDLADFILFAKKIDIRSLDLR